MNLYDLKIEYMRNPLAVDMPNPVFSWKMNEQLENTMQKSYRLQVWKEDKTLTWDSGKVEGNESIGIQYKGQKLESNTLYFVSVQAEDNHGHTAELTERFQTGFFHYEDWKAKWVVPNQVPAYHEPQSRQIGPKRRELDSIIMRPAQMVRKEFELSSIAIKARAFVTAHGVYELYINGMRVGSQELAPGNSSYHKYLSYQVYEINSYLRQGQNVIGMLIGDGWYCGKIGPTGDSCQFGDLLAGLFQLEITLEDGNLISICSDEECFSSEAPIVYSDLYVGEKYDANLEKRGWDKPGYDCSGWKQVTCINYGYANLRAQYGEGVQVMHVRKPSSVFITPKGEVILDTGQVLAGRLRMRVKAPKGTRIMLEHSEILDKEGNFLNNIHGAFSQQTDIYITKGEGTEEYAPRFTYHGFRYVRISGYPGTPSVEDFDVEVFYSNTEQTIQFSCSDSRLNRLQENILWSQRSNTISIPTDCPQREKAGWTGDVQIFAATACVNADMQGFFRRWLNSVRAEQMEEGQIPIIVPFLPAYDFDSVNAKCSAGWGDVAVILPWTLYQIYGDRQVLMEYYDMMAKWCSYIQKTAENELPAGLEKDITPERREWQKYLWNTNFHFGDWLTPSVSFNYETGDVDMIQSAARTMDIVPTCFYAYTTQLMSEIAKVLGKKADEEYYKDLNQHIKEAFAKEFMDTDGAIRTKLQGVYVLALKMRLVPENLRKNAVSILKEMIHDNNDRLDTGFLSIPFLLDVLTEEGETALAYQLLFQEECPSWLYEVKMGATTIWEAWQAVLPDGTPTSVSYNHYAFGCVADWMYRYVGGIQSLEPGYKKIRIAPILDERIQWAETEYDSIHGKIKTNWKRDGNQLEMSVEIPANTTAEVVLPDGQVIQCGSGRQCYVCKTF